MISKQGALTKIFGDPQAKTIKRLEKKVAAVNALEEKYKKFSKADLQKQTEVLKKTFAEEGRVT